MRITEARIEINAFEGIGILDTEGVSSELHSEAVRQADKLIAERRGEIVADLSTHALETVEWWRSRRTKKSIAQTNAYYRELLERVTSEPPAYSDSDREALLFRYSDWDDYVPLYSFAYDYRDSLVDFFGAQADREDSNLKKLVKYFAQAEPDLDLSSLQSMYSTEGGYSRGIINRLHEPGMSERMDYAYSLKSRRHFLSNVALLRTVNIDPSIER